jgi:hypothetical protein
VPSVPNAAASPLAAAPLRAFAIVAAAIPLHLLLALSTDLSPDEAYYLAAARQPGLVPPLVDHPPLVPWLLRLSDALGGPLELRVRIWAILFSAATGLACVELSRRRGAGREGCILAAWVASFALLPSAGGFVTTPDGAALLAIAVALIVTGDALTLRRAGLAALALLAGALAKVIVLPIALILALTCAGARSPGSRLMLAVVPSLSLPLLIPSLRFQLHHAFADTATEGWSLPGALGAALAAGVAQALLWSPLVLFRGFLALPSLRRSDQAIVWILSGLLLLSAFARAVPPEPNWWAPAALIVVSAAARAAFKTQRAQRALLLSVLLPTAVATAHTLRPFLPLPARADPTARLHGWSRGAGPVDAAGVGPYGPAAESCVYLGECKEIDSYFNKINPHE